MMKQPLKKIAKANKALILALFCLSISACSVLVPKTIEGVHQLAEEQKYEQALTLFDQLPPDQQVEAERVKLKKELKVFEDKTVSAIKKFQASGEFSEAKKVVIQARENNPLSSRIAEAEKQLELAIQRHHNIHQRDYDILYAQYLKQELPILQQLLASDGHKESFQRHYERQREKRAEFAEIIGAEGLLLVEKNNYTAAVKLLKNAEALKSDKRWRDGLAKIERSDSHARQKRTRIANKKKAAAKKAKTNEQNEKRVSIEILKAQYQLQFENGDITACQKSLDEIKSLDEKAENLEWLTKSTSDLELLRQQSLAATLKKGQVQYSNGQIREAILTWKSAQAYAPNNVELKERIRRAEAFEARYKELKK